MPKHSGIEQYQDLIGRLYPEDREIKQIDGSTLATSNVTFQVTDDCNLRCSYCYQINKGKHRMPFEVAKKFIDTYKVNKAESSLVLTMQVKVLSVCEEFEENTQNVYNVS